MSKPLKILFVEDSPDDVEIMVDQLQLSGFDPLWKRVETEEDFLDELQRLPDIVISDYSMPQFNGLRAASLLRESGLIIPFILVSGTMGEDTAVEAMKKGAADYLLKDRIARLGSSVEHALQEKLLREQRSLAEQSLVESKLFLQAALDALSSTIAILDEQGNIIEVNTAWEQFESSEIKKNGCGVGANYLEICRSAVGSASKEAAEVAEGITEVIAGRATEFHLEYPCHSPKLKRWFTVKVTRFAGNGPVRVVVAHENITERKQTELDLLWKTTLLEAQLESSIDGILVVDTHGKQVLQNRRMIELWKLPKEIVEARDEAAQVAFAIGQTKKPNEFIERINFLYSHPEETGRDEIELKDGTILDRYSAPIIDTTGKHHGRIWSFRDITENRKLETQFREAQKMESIGQLAGGIAHDFNNILSAIIGNVFLAEMDAGENPEVLRHLAEISKASDRAGNLVKQILAFSRQNKQEREPINLNEVVMEALKLLRASIPSTIRIQTELTDTPPVLANSTSIHQVIMNLGTNAWHAMRDKPGVLKVEMSLLEVDEDFVQNHPDLHVGEYVRLTISDTGSGMDKETLVHIFEPFFTTKSIGEGTGLGLAVVHGIMKSHDGSIYVYSQPGEGTNFQLYFPVLESGVVADKLQQSPVPRGHGEHILYVDDEEVLAQIGKQMLERLGYVVTVKISALEALFEIRNQPDMYDLVITDLTMPNMDGTRLGTQILQIRPKLPIIITTGYSGTLTVNKLREMGFGELLPKPATARTLGEAVYRMLNPGSATEN